MTTRTSELTIRQAILFPVEEIRTTALDYFARSHCEDETLMPLVIQAVEQYGRDKAFNILRDAEDLPQSEATIGWICDELDKDWHMEEVAIDNYCFALGLLLCRARIDLLRPEMVRLRCFPVELVARFRHRIELGSWEWEPLWEELEVLGAESREQGRFDRQQTLCGERIIEALARHPGRQDLVLRLVSRRYRGDERTMMEWLEPLLIELAGKMRLEEAVSVLVERLHEDDLSLSESCMAALKWIGGDRVVEAIAWHWLEGSEDFRRSAAEVLEHIHTDLSAEKCLEFFASEEDEGVKEYLASALMGSFIHEVIEPVRETVRLARPWPELDDLKYRLVAVSTIMGVSFPEYDLWYKQAEEHDWGWGNEYDQERVRESFDEEDDFDDFDEEDFDEEELEDEGWGEELDDDYEQGEDDSLVEPFPPFLRAPVGRNDPCPCGSGKKYKKCCLREVQQVSSPSESQIFPIGTVARYGPDDKTTTKIAAGVILYRGAEPIMKRWVATDVLENPRVKREMDSFFKQYGVRSVGASEGNMGCPHEEGEDFPEGEDCPFCPWWKGKQGSAAEE